jgi:ATP-dependent Lon protease
MISVLVVLAVVTCFYAYPSKCSKFVLQIFEQIRHKVVFDQHPETAALAKECSLALATKILPKDVDKGIKEKLRCLEKLNPDKNTPTLQMFWGMKKYLEKICSIPWGIYTKDNLDVKDVQSKLNSSLFGVQRLKDRIIEHVSISNLKNEPTGFSVWLIASVGQGKETCARAVANALNRKFVAISMKDLTGDSFKGSHKHGTGEIVEALIASQCMNPVIYLKEFGELKYDDGTSSGRQSLMEVRKVLSSAKLPYKDEYIGYHVDISKVIFIVGSTYTPSYSSTIDGEYGISFFQHNPAQRNEFLTKWLIPKSMKEAGLKPGQLDIKPEAMKVILDGYIGCWNVLSYQKMIIDTICRKAATKVTNSEDIVTINAETVDEYLIVEKRYHFDTFESSEPGIVSCISASVFRTIETSIVRPLRDRGMITMSGQPGLNLKESINTAKAVANMVLKDTELENSINDHIIHINFPRQSSKKDDSEMGIGVLVALLSLVSKTTIPKGTMFCGELTLSQTILGDAFMTLRNRVITAQKRECKRLFLSTQSEKQWNELEPDLTKDIEPVFIKNVSDIISALFASSELAKRNDLLHMYN